MSEGNTKQPDLHSDSPHVFSFTLRIWTTAITVETNGESYGGSVVSHEHENSKISHPITDCFVSMVLVDF
jgi:hypothetical protein